MFARVVSHADYFHTLMVRRRTAPSRTMQATNGGLHPSRTAIAFAMPPRRVRSCVTARRANH